MKRTTDTLLPILLALLCAGCGGGGSGSDGPPAPDPAPALVNDIAATNAGEAVSINVLANDVNATGGTVSVSVAPGNGTTVIDGTTVIYTPEAGFAGSDFFDYQVTVAGFSPRTARVTVNVNALPVANADSFSVVENTPTTLDVLANDTDDGAIADIEILTAPDGIAEVEGGAIRFTPLEGFLGTDTFSYRAIDAAGVASNAVVVTIEVEPILTTQLEAITLAIPTEGYSKRIDPASGAVHLSSPLQPLPVPPNTVSFLLALSGEDADIDRGVYISHVIAPNEPLEPLAKEVVVCDDLLCSAYQPRKPGQSTPAGEWQFRLGTREVSLDTIDFSGIDLHLVTRTGPAPDPVAVESAIVPVRPFLTASSVTTDEFDAILAEFVNIADANGIEVELRPTVVVSEPQFEEVSSNFGDPTTAELVSRGDADAANIFFIESFTGLGGRIGIAPGIPGTQGIQGPLNGVIINATVTRDDPDIYIRTTAEFAFHEMGHLLGLFHTTEADFSHDILSDTPACTREDTTASTPRAQDCPDGLNVMFWTNDFDRGKVPLTDGQRYVIDRAPIAMPAMP